MVAIEMKMKLGHIYFIVHQKQIGYITYQAEKPTLGRKCRGASPKLMHSVQNKKTV